MKSSSLSSSSLIFRLLLLVAVLFTSSINGQRDYRRQGYSLTASGQEEASGEFWKCNLAMNACHFRNQYNLARFSRYHNPVRPFYNEASALVLDLASAGARKFPGARLISHYFPARRVDACLHISYLMVGASPRAFYVIQQDKVIIWVKLGSESNRKGCRCLKVPKEKLPHSWEGLVSGLMRNRG